MKAPSEALLIKLWETAERVGSALFKPWQTRREGKASSDAKRHEKLLLAQAEIDIEDIRLGKKKYLPNGELTTITHEEAHPLLAGPKVESEQVFRLAHDVASQRAAVDLIRAEINTTKAILYAEEQLENDPSPAPTENIDNDWLHVWREYAGKVSNEDLQRLWGNLLAGQVKSPGKYTLRTLELLKSITQHEANQISSIAPYIFGGCISRTQINYIASKGVSLETLLDLQDIGILAGVDSTGISSTLESLQPGTYFNYMSGYSKCLLISTADPSAKCQIDSIILTKVGRQVLQLGTFESDKEYFQLVGMEFISQGFMVQIADWEPMGEIEGKYFNPTPLVADASTK